MELLQLEPEPANQFIGSTPASIILYMRRYLPDVTFTKRGIKKPKFEPSRELPIKINIGAHGGLHLASKVQGQLEYVQELTCGHTANPAITATLIAIKYIEENFADTVDALPGVIEYKLGTLGFDKSDAAAAVAMLATSGSATWISWVRAKNGPVWDKKKWAAHTRLIDVRRTVETAVHGQSIDLAAGEVVRNAWPTGTAVLDGSAWYLWHFHRPVTPGSRFPSKITLRIPDTGMIEVQGLDRYSREFVKVRNVESLLKKLKEA